MAERTREQVGGARRLAVLRADQAGAHRLCSPRRRPNWASHVLQPVLTHHTAVERVNVERLRANAVEAAEQTERLSVPEVRAAVALGRAARPTGRQGAGC